MAKTKELSTVGKKVKLTKKGKSAVKAKKPGTEVAENEIRYGKDEYLIIRVNNKHKLGMVIMKGRLLLEDGVEEDDTSETIDFNPEDVVACLGKNPPTGLSAFGCNLEFYEQTFTDKNWGPVHFFRKIQKEREMKHLKQVLDKAFKKLSEHKATGFLPLNRIDLRIKKGKYAGSYHYNPKKGDKMTLRPEDLIDRTYLLYVVLHEAGHGVWYRTVPYDIRVKWTELFQKRVSKREPTEKQLRDMAKALVQYESFKSFAKDECDDEDKKVLKEAFAYVKRVHKLTEAQLESLVQSKGGKAILDYWPKTADIGVVSPDITEYAMEKVEEFFAEAFAYFMTGKQLPKDVTKAMQYTLKNLVKDYGDA